MQLKPRCHARFLLSCKTMGQGRIEANIATIATKRMLTKMPIVYHLALYSI
jgi:hypothetical protein